MIEKKINIQGNEYIKMKKIKGKKNTYIEYRCEELGAIKFFEIENGSLTEISDKVDLREAIGKNYIIK